MAVFTVLLVIVIATSPALSDLADLLWLKIRIWLGIELSLQLLWLGTGRRRSTR